MTFLASLGLLAGLYPVGLVVLVTVDRLTGWQIAEAFGKEGPR